jgi:hypothetical protein
MMPFASTTKKAIIRSFFVRNEKRNEGAPIPSFLIERNFADAVEMSHELAADIKRVNDDIGLQ